MTQNKTLISTNKIKYSLTSGKLLLDEISISIGERDRIGLVGRNGSGKSTLLKILAGKVMQDSGVISGKASIHYLPQIELEKYKSDTPLYEYITKDAEDWWKVIDILAKDFETILNESAPLRTLSGGEIIKVNLAIGLQKQPDILLLDEPTNHLDMKSLNVLGRIIEKFNGAIVVVSHNTHFLNQITNQIWNLEAVKVKTYGGNFNEFKVQRDSKTENDRRKLEQERRTIKRLETIARQKESQARSSDRKVLRDPYLKGLAGKKARSAKILKDKLNKQIEDAQSKYEILKPKKAFLDLQSDNKQKRRLLIDIKNGQLLLPENKLLVDDINLKLYYGERITIAGDNGSGKTSLIKFFAQKTTGSGRILTGDVNITSDLDSVFVDQKYDLVNPEKNLVENVASINPKLNHEAIRKQLGNFLFKNQEEISKPAKYLSGGELAKLTFAMVTAAPIDLLVLDEPTNNLDVETIEVITDALKQFRGAIVVISHNVDFLDQIGVETGYVIEGGKFRTLSLPLG